MFLRFFCKFLILLFISGIFSSRKRLNCSEVDSLINLKYQSKDYESALVIAKSNKKNENCTAKQYFNLGKVFLHFNDFTNTRNLYNKSLLVASAGKGYDSMNLEYIKLRHLQSEISFIQQILNNDQDKENAISNYQGLLFGNKKWDNGEPYADINLNDSYDEKNGVWDNNEKFTDNNGNGTWDEAEEFIDCNSDQSICADDWKSNINDQFKDLIDCSIKNGETSFILKLTIEECILANEDENYIENRKKIQDSEIIDANNSAYDFIDCTVGDASTILRLTIQDCILANEDENYLKNKSKIESKLWDDSMGNGVWDEGEDFIDKDGNGVWSDAEDFTDKNEDFTDWSFPDNGYLHLLIADIYKRSQDYTNAIYHLNEALKINPYVKSYKEQMSVISKMIAQQGNDFLRLNKLDEAIEKYKLSLSIDDSESVIHYNLANAYFQKNNFLEAIDSYKEVEKLDPNKYKASHKMGVCYQKLGEHDLAVAQFEKAIIVIEELDENFMSSYNEMALSLMQLNLYADATKALNIIINKSPRYYKAYETLGVLCLEATDAKYKSNECALENFLEAAKIKPNDHVLKFRLAQLYNIAAEEYKEEQNYKKMNTNLNEAKKYARQCRQLKKTYGGAYFELGVAELNLCNKSSGIKALQLAAKYDRRYRSEVKRIIKKIEPFMNHCE